MCKTGEMGKSITNNMAKVLFFVYVITLIMITVIRPWNANYQLLGGSLNLTLFADYKAIVQGSIARFIYLFVGNIIWFVPLGAYCVAVKGRSLTATMLLGLAISLCIETMQYILGTGVSEIDDLVLNTLGCLIGGALSSIICKRSSET